MSDTVVFLGAGATKACKGPLTSEILPLIYQDARSTPDRPDRLAQFLEDQFHVHAGLPNEAFPGLPLLLSLLDTAIDRRQAFCNDLESSAVSELRQMVEIGIYDLLERMLTEFQTNNHWDLFNSLYPLPGPEPCVISTNYDLVADTALMYLSESRPGTLPGQEGRLPDYRCDIRTHFRDNESGKFGQLLKLHGSLNWLHCSTCSRLEMGTSAAKPYLKVLNRMAAPDLRKAFTEGGDPCETCGTQLRPLLVAPSHLKYYRNVHLSQVWYAAEHVLRKARRVIFVGYSLPEDDVEVIYLLKRSMGRPSGPKITVIESNPSNPSIAAADHPVGRRYRALFGEEIEWHACGLNDWLRLPTRA